MSNPNRDLDGKEMITALNSENSTKQLLSGSLSATSSKQSSPLSALLSTGLLIALLLMAGMLGMYFGQNPIDFQSLATRFRACSSDTKTCPDGSVVSRVEPDCEFAPCPKVTPTPSPTPSLSAPVKPSANDGFNRFQLRVFSFEFPVSWRVVDYVKSININPRKWNQRVYFSTSTNEVIQYFEFLGVAELPIEELYNTYEAGFDEENQPLAEFEGKIEGQKMLLKVFARDETRKDPKDFEEANVFATVNFWCNNNFHRFRYFALNQGSSVKEFENLLKSINCTNSNTEQNSIPSLDPDLFKKYPSAVENK